MLKKGPLSLAKTEPTSALSPFEEFERRFEDFFRRPFSMMESPWWTRWPGLAGEVSPAMDIYEEGDDIVVKAEMPGMKKEEIHIDINEKSVTVSGEKKKEEKVERKDYVHLERTYGSFARTFAVPSQACGLCSPRSLTRDRVKGFAGFIPSTLVLPLHQVSDQL